MKTSLDIVREFKTLVHNYGLEIDEVVSDGTLRRFKDRSRGDHNPNGYYKLYIDPQLRFAWGFFGHWSFKSGRVQQNFRWYNDGFVTTNKKNDINILIKDAQKEVMGKVHEERRTAINAALEIWKKSRRLDFDTKHKYLEKKKIIPIGIKLYHKEDGTKALIIPIYTSYKKRELVSLQYIYEDGSKRFQKNTSPKDGFFIIGESINNLGTVCICEGYATGVSIYQALGYKTIVAFSADNLISVAQLIRKDINPKKIIICADNDSHLEENIGLNKAKQAAELVNGEVVYPTFKDIRTLPTDFNDLANLEGIDAIKEHFLKKTEIKTETYFSLQSRVFTRSEQLIEPWLENNTLNMIYSQPGVGKTWLCLHIAYALASGRSIAPLNWNVKKKCKVVYIDSELKGDKLQKYLKCVGGDSWTYETSDNFITLNSEDLDICKTSPDFFSEEWRKAFDAEVINLRRPSPESNLGFVVIIDNLLELFTDGDLNKPKDWSVIKKWFNYHIRTGVCFILVHHTGKYTGQYIGTQKIMSGMSTALMLSKNEENTNEDDIYSTASFLLECTKDRYANKKIQSYNVVIRTDQQREVSVIEAQPAIKRVKEQIIDMYNEENITYREIANRINVNRTKKIDASYICKCIKAAKKDGLIKEKKQDMFTYY